jgi:hypothetical protein
MTIKISLGPQGEPLFEGTQAELRKEAELRKALGTPPDSSVVAGTDRADAGATITPESEEWKRLAAKYAPMCESGAFELVGFGPQLEPLFKPRRRPA